MSAPFNPQVDSSAALWILHNQSAIADILQKLYALSRLTVTITVNGVTTPANLRF